MSDRRLAPTAILQQAISQFEEEGSHGLADFVAAPKFQGARPGYYFGRGPSGQGYYLDSKQRSPGAGADDDDAGAAAAAAAVARKAAQPVDAEELLREAEEAAGDAGLEMLDLKGLKRLTLALERKYNANLEARMRYADQPSKFLESEADLDEAVKGLLVVATAPDLYPDLVASTSAVPTLLALLNHENSDIAADAVEVLSELTDGDAVEDNEEEARVLVDCLLENDALSLLVHRLSAFDEAVAAEAGAVYNVLSIIENMVEVKPEVAETVLEKTKLLKWLLGRLRPREVDSNKQYASEILAILVQQSDANKRKMGASNGIDAVLQAIAPYRNRDPETTEEEEYVENLFDVVASCLLLEENKGVFVEAEGVELLLLILKGKRSTRTPALKCLDFATTRCPPACDRVVDQQGLKTLFGMFMGKLKVKRKDESAAAEEEERTVSIIASLLNQCTKQSRRDRVAAKFVENEFEKCDRLMEVFSRYEARVAAEEARLAAEAEADDELDEDELLLARMDAGLYTLQQCALVVGALWLVGDVGVRKRVLRLLHQRGRTLASLRAVLHEFRANLGDDGGAEERARQAERATQMLLALGHNPAEEEAAERAAAEAKAAQAAEPGAGDGMAGGGVDMDVEEGAERGAKAAAPAEAPAPPADEAMELEEGEERTAADARADREQGQRRGRDEKEAPARERGDREREKQGERRRERERRRSRSRERERDRGERQRQRSRSRSRSPDKERERRREKERRRSRSRSRERSRRDRR